MAKKRNKHTEAKRETLDFSSPRLHSPINYNALLRDLTPKTVEDRREYHPTKRIVHPAGSVFRDARRLVERVTKSFRYPSVLGFAHPKAVAVCVRRKERREVLFAFKRTRRGAGARKHRNSLSSISCK